MPRCTYCDVQVDDDGVDAQGSTECFPDEPDITDRHVPTKTERDDG